MARRVHFYEVDSLAHDSWYVLRASLVRGAAMTLPALLLSPYRLSRYLSARLDVRSRHRWQREQIAANRNFDFGAVTSVRELASGHDVNRYFLGIDRDMYVKVVQLRVLKHILEFLEMHSVDTSDFARQQLNINNSHTINVAGNVGQGAAVGSQARGGDVRVGESSAS